jgi:hypothetical protein
MARVGEAWKARRAMGVRWASSWRDSRAGRNEVAIVCVCEVDDMLAASIEMLYGLQCSVMWS